jgi:hypothetical protein
MKEIKMINLNDSCPCPETEDGARVFIWLYPELAPLPKSWSEKQKNDFQNLVNKMIDKKKTVDNKIGEKAYNKEGEFMKDLFVDSSQIIAIRMWAVEQTMKFKDWSGALILAQELVDFVINGA